MLSQNEPKSFDVPTLERLFQNYVQVALRVYDKPLEVRSAMITKLREQLSKNISLNSSNDSIELTYYKILIGSIIFYIQNMVTDQHSYALAFCKEMENLLHDQKRFSHLFIQNELYDKYFILNMRVASQVVFYTYEDLNEMPQSSDVLAAKQKMLVYILFIRDCLEAYLSKRDDCTDSYTMSARYMLVMLSYAYIYTIFRLQDKDNLLLKALFDRPMFEKYYKKFMSRLESRGLKRSSEEDCLYYLLNAYECNVTYSSSMLTPEKTTFDSMLAKYLRFISVFTSEDFFKFLKKRSDECGDQSFYQIPELRIGCNLYLELFNNVIKGMSSVEDVLDECIKQCPVNEIKSDPAHRLWIYMHSRLTLKKAIILSRYRFVNYKIIGKYGDRNELEDNANKTIATINDINKTLKEMDDAKDAFTKKQNDYIAQLSRDQQARTKFVSVKKKNPVHKKIASNSTHSSSTKENVVLVEPEKKQEKSEIDEIGKLLRQKKFQDAIARYKSLLLKEQKAKNQRQIIRLNMCLGDAHKYHAIFIEHPKKRVRALQNSKKFYQQCLNAIDKLGDEIEDDDEMQSMKYFIQEMLVLIEKDVRPKPVQVVAPDVTVAPVSDVQSETGSSSSTSSMQLSPPSTPPATSILPALSFYTYQLILPDYVTDVLNTLIQCGYDTYLVGGAVRDPLLGRDVKDYDIVTNSPWDVIDYLFSQVGKIVGSHHPVCLIEGEGVKNIQISTMKARKLGPNPSIFQMSDGTIITYQNTNSIAEDALSRDFTCNALYYSPLNQMIFDPCNGYRDAMAKQIVFINAPSFALNKDPALILRAMRLMIGSGFTIEQSVDELMCTHAPMLNRMNQIRLRQELDKTKSTEGDETNKQALMKKYGLLQLDASLSMSDHQVFFASRDTKPVTTIRPPMPAVILDGEHPGSIVYKGVTYFSVN